MATAASFSSTIPSRPTYSCMRCAGRKVKCDRQRPCAACVKHNAECVFAPSQPPRKRHKPGKDQALTDRLRYYEVLLEEQGIDPSKLPGAPKSEPRPRSSHIVAEGAKGSQLQTPVSTEPEPSQSIGKIGRSRLVEQGRTKFFENTLYSDLNEEIQANDDILESSSGDESEPAPELADTPHSIEFMLGISPTSAPLVSLHPPPEIIYKLWQVFLSNINPLTKIIHQPTLQSAIFDASFNLEKVPKGLEALMFAIYASATYSMTEKDCIDMLHKEKTDLLARYRLGLRKALVRANFLATSELQVLQAFTIYLLSMRMLYDARTMWILAGVANRIGQSLGLHRDGTILGLPPFDTEMRRRLWWQIAILDSRSAELSGLNRRFEPHDWSIQLPANVDDAQLWPQMTEAPVPATNKATEMISCCLRYEFVDVFRRSTVLPHNRLDGDRGVNHPDMLTTEKDKVNNELERYFEERYVRYCDPSVPIHYYTLIVARASIHIMRMMAHHPRHRLDKARVQSKEELDTVFTVALKIVECDNICHSSPFLQRFLWHTHAYFAWHALLFLLGELRTRTTGSEIDAAWQQIEEVYEHHPAFLTDTKRPLHVATGSLCLKAWNAREAALANKGLAAFPLAMPAFIQTLRQQRSRSKNTSKASQPPLADGSTNLYAANGQVPEGLFPVTENSDMDLGANGELDINMLADFSMEDVSPMNWDDWDTLVNGYGTSQFSDWTNLPGLSG